MDESTDLHNYRPRLIRLAIAAAIGGVFTFFAIQAMTSSGRGPNEDPIGSGSVTMLGVFMFVITTIFALKIISKRRPSAGS